MVSVPIIAMCDTRLYCLSQILCKMVNDPETTLCEFCHSVALL